MITQTSFEDISIFCMGRKFGKKPLYPVYCYLIGDLLIDTGTILCRDEFKNALINRPISVVINTHPHEDHIGTNEMLITEKHAKIYAHPDAIKTIGNPKELHLKGYQKLAWGLPSSSQAEPIPSEIKAEKYRFKIIDTPGHTQSHVCLYEPSKRWLFSGDLHIGELSLKMQPFDNYNQILESLKKLAPLDIAEIFCAHQGHIPDGKAVLTKKIAFMEDIQKRALELHEKGVSLKEITRKIAGKEDFMTLITRGHISKRNAISSILNLR